MHAFRKVVQLVSLGLAVALWGCGGSSSDTSFRPLGEGNIPIGRVPIDAGTCRCVVNYSDGSSYTTLSRNGIVYSSILPPGLTSLTILPQHPFYGPQSFAFEVGTEQNYQFNAHLSTRQATSQSGSIKCNIPDGAVLKVGQRYPITVRVLAATPTYVTPTIVLSGGYGTLDDKDILTPTRQGQGQIRLIVAGTEKDINVTCQ